MLDISKYCVKTINCAGFNWILTVFQLYTDEMMLYYDELCPGSLGLILGYRPLDKQKCYAYDP